MPDDQDEAAGIDRLLDRAVAALGGTRRDGQLTMAREVARAVETGEHLLVQAGTGTGKSLAYLVPAVAHAVRTDERVVVSTATLALQRQVVGRDLPLVADALAGDLPRRPAVALLKGWQHYLCVHKVAGGYPAEETLFDAEEAAPDPAGLGAQVLRLREWAAGTGTGDRDELVPGVSERAWRQVSVTSLECLGRRCPMLGECFAEAAREQSRRADVVVTNHAMLAVAATGSAQVLPEHQVLVVDEAHELADRVTAQATLELSIATIEQAARSARRHGGVPTTDLDSAGQQLATVLVGTPEGRFSGSLTAPLAEAVGAVRDAARALVSALRPASPGQGGDQVAEGGRSMAGAAMLALFETAQTMAGDAEELAQTVLWCARGQDPRGVPQTRLHAAPLAVNGLIRSRLLDGRSATLTSATLALGGSFDSAARSVGLAPAGDGDQQLTWRALDVGSPFDYGRQGICYVAKHLPAPGRDPATDAQLDEIEALVRAAGGRTLGLFSSRRAATAAAAAMRERLDVPVLVQGDDQLATLVDRFTAEASTCLFGTLSLWQGVDVPGSTCQLVVIDRIPFPRPDDPVSSARSEAVARAGGNGFMAVAASHAALLLAQGAGRLIRTTADRGVVAVLDPRLATSRYGEYLMRSMPPFWRTTDRQVALDALSRLAAADEPAVRPVDAPGEPG
ncbi:MAG: ATP-dependent DNA helicase [Cellulomonas sp.]|nr:ATP-dependent DNA helicase [Cellulomonas sp.]